MTSAKNYWQQADTERNDDFTANAKTLATEKDRLSNSALIITTDANP